MAINLRGGCRTFLSPALGLIFYCLGLIYTPLTIFPWYYAKIKTYRKIHPLCVKTLKANRFCLAILKQFNLGS